MPKFKYEAMDSDGQTVKEEVVARDTDQAVAKIREDGLFPTRVKQVSEKKEEPTKAASAGATRGGATRGGATSGGGRRKPKKGGGGIKSITIGGVSSKNLTTFTRQLSTLTDAGVPVVQSLNILHEQMKQCTLKKITAQVAEDVEGGSSLSEALGEHPKAFDNLYVNMVRAGEAGGVLDTVLQRLAEFREKAGKLKKRVIGAMMYPVAVLTFAGLILTGIIVFIIPKFMKMFEELNVELPLPTKILLTISHTTVNYWYLLPAIPIGIVMLYKLIRASQLGKYTTDWVKFHFPLFGALSKKSSIARFTRTFGTLISSGVPILEALSITRDTVGNSVLSSALNKVHDSIREGEPIAQPLGQTNVCDDMVVNMIDVGEETGNLDTMLNKIADNYDEEVDTMVESLTSLMEPIMIIGLGLIIGFIVVSLFLPLISLMSSLS
ncbi:pilus assembly protein PilC [candidate division MSBL1 archaeon SCGC-AAA382A20]|uniref:Pilus assembly protein PilC n=1 Tax=candidate division MSBL1 archaeon SCGC-AAA382A20 TaxID=1698280 RepID=A0A133VHL3_9EURY|nr:pilus assembly protein PilC [candidate division MSBL1 archaeon SCGC-AAA382A20]